jgi:hypothetical protein
MAAVCVGCRCVDKHSIALLLHLQSVTMCWVLWLICLTSPGVYSCCGSGKKSSSACAQCAQQPFRASTDVACRIVSFIDLLLCKRRSHNSKCTATLACALPLLQRPLLSHLVAMCPPVCLPPFGRHQRQGRCVHMLARTLLLSWQSIGPLLS